MSLELARGEKSAMVLIEETEMNDLSNVQAMLDFYRRLSTDQQKLFLTNVLDDDQTDARVVESETTPDSFRFKEGLFCPHCSCKNVVKRGFTAQGKQRYFCKDCKHSFLATTNTMLQYSKKDVSLWLRYVECMANHMSIRKTAKACGINKTTSFEWRHKILDALKNRLFKDKTKLSASVEADETFFHLSFKGCRNIEKIAGRPAHKRGNAITKRGISKEQVCVPTAIDINNKAFAQVGKLGTANLTALTLTLGKRIEVLATLKTDSLKAYKGFCDRFNLNHIAFKPAKKSHPLPHINAYHSTLKQFMRPFNGVATKYLNNYLSWFNHFRQAEFENNTKEVIFSDNNIDSRESMRLRNPIPVVA